MQEFPMILRLTTNTDVTYNLRCILLDFIILLIHSSFRKHQSLSLMHIKTANYERKTTFTMTNLATLNDNLK